MQVNISITLTQDDIDAGLTADAAVKKAFPNGSTEAPYVDTSLTDEIIEQDAVTRREAETFASDVAYHEHAAEEIEASGSEAEEDTIHAPESDEVESPEFREALAEEPGDLVDEDELELDSAGVPWNSEIHSSNQKKYGPTSKESGRWIWKKGSDSVARAELAQQLAAGLAPSAEAAPAETDPVDMGGAVAVAPPAPENAAPPAPPAPPAAENLAPPAPPVAPPAAVPAGSAPATWPEFLQSLKNSGKTAGDVTPLLAPAGVETIAQLATNDEARNNIAAQLGLSA